MLFLFFILAGWNHGLRPVAEVAEQAKWAADVPVGLLRFIGFAEIAGAIGVVLPWLTSIRPALTSLAAAGLALIMMLAFGFHIMRGETGVIGMHAVVAAIAMFVAWGRRPAP
jgi:putative oxidoreductase